MTAISRIYSAQPVSEEANAALVEFANEVAAAITKAKQAGILQGFLVATLAGHFHQETANMIAAGDSDE
ncbi:MAG: hypothetical protein ACLGID_14505 [Gammaproteobacteria bacterium]